MRVTRTLHHSVNVEGRLNPTVEFYRRLLELPSDPRPEIPGVGGHWFDAGNAQLHLVDAVAAGDVQPTGPHVCFAVDDLDATLDRLRAAGVHVRNEVLEFHDRRLVFVLGPEDVTIELAEWQGDTA